MDNERTTVPAVEARTEKVMIGALLAVAALAIYGLFVHTERGAALSRVTSADVPAQTQGVPPTAADAAH